MKIVLDLQTLQSESRHRGIGSYTRGLARQLLVDHSDIEWHALLNGAMPDHLVEARQWLGEWLAPERIHVFSGLSPTSGLDPLNEPRARASGCLRDRFLESLHPDLVLTMSPFDGFGDNTVVGQSTIRPAFVEMAIAYDFIPFQYPELYLATAQIEHWFRARLDRLRQADHVLAISEYTAKVAVEAFEFSPDRVSAIGTDANPLFRRLADHEIDAPGLKRTYGIKRPFFLHVGILERRKNVPLLVRAFARLSPDLQARHQLVLVAAATEAQKSELLNLARELGIAPDSLVFAGHVPSEDLVRLYHLAEASFMPSRAEGFGLPLLEAMRCGSPAFGARATSLPEVIGEDAFLFDPEQPQECARLMERIVTEPAFRTLARDHAVARSKAFGWASTAEKTVELCRKLVAQASSRPETSLRSSTASAVQAKSPPLRFFKSLFGKQTSASIRHNARNESSDGLESTGVPVRTLDLDQNDNRDSWIEALDGPVFLRLKGTASLTWAKLSARERYRILGYRAKAHPIGADEPLSLAEMAKAFGPLVLGVVWNKEGDLWEGATADGALFTSNGAHASDQILETMAKRSPMAPTRRLADDIRRIDGLHLADRIAIAEAAGRNHRPLASQPRLLVDVTHLAQFDAKSGIQRVVRNILNGLLARPLHYRVEPIYREGGRYWFAREFGARFFGIPNPGLGETNVDFRPDDVFLGLDLDAAIDEAGVQTLVEAHTRGMRIVLVVYDILPIRRPEWFDRGMSAAFKTWLAYLSRYADGLACISQATADDVRDYLTAKGNGFHDRVHGLAIEAFHLGADLDPHHAQPEANNLDLAQMTGADAIFLSVGTLEPRKGYGDVLDTAEALWQRGHNVAFVFAGKKGWLVDRLLKRLKKHPELGKRLIFLEQPSDAQLRAAYRQAHAVLLASEGEGFGLPLIEAAHEGKPVLARNLPVFREIGRDGAFYLSGAGGPVWADQIEAWLKLYAKGLHPKSDLIRPMTWDESTAALLDRIETTPWLA